MRRHISSAEPVTEKIGAYAPSRRILGYYL